MTGSVALATQEFSARFFANGARPDYALQTDAAMGQDAVENIRNQIEERHGGLRNSHKPMLLHSGLKAQSLQLPLEDLQLLATRQFQIEDIARAFGVQPFMVGHSDKTSSWGSGIEAMGVLFVRYTLGRHLTKIRTELNRKLFRTYARYVDFDTFDLERADMLSMMNAFRVAIGRAGEPGFLTVDEVRGYLNRAPMPGGDQLNKGLPDAQPQPAQPAGQ
jgi:HK97 family phage portal protein